MKISMLGTVAAAVHLLFAPGAQAASAPKPATQNRADIAAQYKWDFSPIYGSWDAWEAAMKDIEAKMDAFAARKGSLKNGPSAVLSAYQAQDEIGMMQYKVYRYPQLQRDVETRNQDIAGKFQRVGAIFAKFGTATAWFTPELLKIPQATMEQWIRDTPALAPYQFTILDNYRQQQHVLDEQGEKLLSYRRPFQPDADSHLSGAVNVRHQVPQGDAVGRQRAHAQSRHLPVGAANQLQPGRPGQGV
jgi:oligoendopeptidase F